jgi:hypothetical protein
MNLADAAKYIKELEAKAEQAEKRVRLQQEVIEGNQKVALETIKDLTAQLEEAKKMVSLTQTEGINGLLGEITNLQSQNARLKLALEFVAEYSEVGEIIDKAKSCLAFLSRKCSQCGTKTINDVCPKCELSNQGDG